MKENEAIELGKIWMKNSINRGHDYEHAENVEKHALEIFKEMKEKGLIHDDTDVKLVSLASWWHDTYKARMKKTTLRAFFLEGYESEKIVRNELKSYLSPKRLDSLCAAVRYHNHFLLYFLFSKTYAPLIQILIEADNIEAMSSDRLNRSFHAEKFPLLGLAFKINTMNIIFWHRKLHPSDYLISFISKLKT
ncbi:HD domain-containing protein [Candidatus Dojkabacteria bacterium]|nr:HD domain-containing protein [Candidatus Dojkabacteria bacterium]